MQHWDISEGKLWSLKCSSKLNHWGLLTCLSPLVSLQVFLFATFQFNSLFVIILFLTISYVYMSINPFSPICIQLNSPKLGPYFSLNKFERILLSIFISLLCLINHHFRITKCRILYVLCEEKLGVDNCLGLKEPGVILRDVYLLTLNGNNEIEL